MSISHPRDGSASFTTFLREHDVPCPACGYNLRGLSQPACPECGAKAGWGAYRTRLPNPRLTRGLEGLVLAGVCLAVFLVIARAPRAIGAREEVRILATIGMPAAWLLGAGYWAAQRRRIAGLPAYLQARWVSLAAVALTAFVLLAIGARVI